MVYIEGVVQRPTADYSLDSTSNVSFTAAPPVGSNVNILQLSTGSSYTLPTASTTTLGGVKVDGSTITINAAGVISSAGGGGITTGKAIAMAIVFGG